MVLSKNIYSSSLHYFDLIDFQWMLCIIRHQGGEQDYLLHRNDSAGQWMKFDLICLIQFSFRYFPKVLIMQEKNIKCLVQIKFAVNRILINFGRKFSTNVLLIKFLFWKMFNENLNKIWMKNFKRFLHLQPSRQYFPIKLNS